MSCELLLSLRFGRNSDDANYLGLGWSGGEDGFRWMTGGRSELWLDWPGAGDYLIEFELAPFVHLPSLPVQRFAVSVRGIVIGRSVLSGLSTLGYRIPADLMASRGPVRLGLEHPDAARPVDLIDNHRDARQLAVSMRRLGLYRILGDMSLRRLDPGATLTAADIGRIVGIPALQLMSHFESLGDNSEFALVQRHCGAEPIGLLRYSGITLDSLIRGLMEEFEALDVQEDLELTLSGERREYVLRHRRYGLTFRTSQYADKIGEGELMVKQLEHLGLLRRKFLEDLRSGDKIFLVKRNDPLSEQDVLPLHAALNRFAANTLLFVTPADVTHLPGTVERLLPSLLRGNIDKFAPQDDPTGLSLAVWLRICVNAFLLTLSEAGTISPTHLSKMIRNR